MRFLQGPIGHRSAMNHRPSGAGAVGRPRAWDRRRATAEVTAE